MDWFQALLNRYTLAFSLWECSLTSLCSFLICKMETWTLTTVSWIVVNIKQQSNEVLKCLAGVNTYCSVSCYVGVKMGMWIWKKCKQRENLRGFEGKWIKINGREGIKSEFNISISHPDSCYSLVRLSSGWLQLRGGGSLFFRTLPLVDWRLYLYMLRILGPWLPLSQLKRWFYTSRGKVEKYC